MAPAAPDPDAAEEALISNTCCVSNRIPFCVALTVGGALIATLLAGCTSSGTSDPSSSAPPITSTSASGTTPAPASPSAVKPTEVAKSGGLSADQVKAALLSGDEVGSGLSTAKPDTSDAPFPCTPDDPPPDVQVPPKASAKTMFSNDTQDIELTEQVESYADNATAAKALAVGEKGLTCDIGTVGNQQVTIQGPIDLSTSFTTKLDKAELWAVSGSGARQSIIVAKMGQRIVAVTFAELSGANDTGLDAKGIADRAIAKVGAAG